MQFQIPLPTGERRDLFTPTGFSNKAQGRDGKSRTLGTQHNTDPEGVAQFPGDAAMARISESHPKYRTKRQMAADVAYVLAAPLSYGTKFAVLNNVCWTWTEFDGKYRGCRYWSKMARMARSIDRKAKLIHEHVVPRQVVIDALMAMKSPTPENVYQVLDRFLIAVIVTPEEDAYLSCEHQSTMPAAFLDPTSDGYHEPWLRYRSSPIEIIDRHDSKELPEASART